MAAIRYNFILSQKLKKRKSFKLQYNLIFNRFSSYFVFFVDDALKNVTNIHLKLFYLKYIFKLGKKNTLFYYSNIFLTNLKLKNSAILITSSFRNKFLVFSNYLYYFFVSSGIVPFWKFKRNHKNRLNNLYRVFFSRIAILLTAKLNFYFYSYFYSWYFDVFKYKRSINIGLRKKNLRRKINIGVIKFYPRILYGLRRGIKYPTYKRNKIK